MPWTFGTRMLWTAAVQHVAETCGRVDVVLHAAGIDNSKALRSKPWKD